MDYVRLLSLFMDKLFMIWFRLHTDPINFHSIAVSTDKSSLVTEFERTGPCGCLVIWFYRDDRSQRYPVTRKFDKLINIIHFAVTCMLLSKSWISISPIIDSTKKVCVKNVYWKFATHLLCSNHARQMLIDCTSRSFIF